MCIRDRPYIIIAKDSEAVESWLEFTNEAEENPEEVLADIESGAYNDIKVPVMFSNIHSNAVAAVDGIMEFAWTIIKAADDENNGNIPYDTLTAFTEAGETQLAAEMGPVGAAGSTAAVLSLIHI